MSTTRSGSPVHVTCPVVVVLCGCGFLPLDKAMHRTATAAWQAAAAHVALNPTKCKPTMHRDNVPAMLVP
jgi:hypothetical protein